MLMLEEALARVRTTLDVETSQLTIMDGNRQLVVADLNDEEERAKVSDIIWQLVPALRSAPALVRSPDAHFMDKPDNVISLINLATVRSLEEQWGIKINPLRFRANFYIDGAKPWEEFDWVGSDIRIGNVLFRVDRRNGRCGATNVDRKPDAAISTYQVHSARLSGHKELGVLSCRAGKWERDRGKPRRHVRCCRDKQPGTTIDRRAIESPDVHVRRMLLYLRPIGRHSRSVHCCRDAFRRHPRGLEMPGLRHRQINVSSLCSNTPVQKRRIKRAILAGEASFRVPAESIRLVWLPFHTIRR